MFITGNSGFPKNHDISKAIDKAAGAEREVVGQKHVTNAAQGKGLGHGDLIGGKVQAGFIDVTAPATPEAVQWSGWGTALKPAYEPIVVARKPLVGTVAANVLEYGTGALNIDGCRIETNDGYAENRVTQGINTAQTSYAPASSRRTFEPSTGGRWPANVLLDEEAAALLDAQSGITTSRKGKPRDIKRSGDGWGMTKTGAGHDDKGGASRFFYCAKASKKDRGEDNTHPTVKPNALMRYLVRLVTPPGGIVLDPFAGSGSTGVAAVQEGFNFIGFEREEEYVQIAESRINKVLS